MISNDIECCNKVEILHLNISGREYKIKKSIINKIPYFYNMLEICDHNRLYF